MMSANLNPGVEPPEQWKGYPPSAYGDDFQGHLLEQYKLCVEMADRVSARRGSVNTFYISLLSGLLAFLSLVLENNLFSGPLNVLLLVTAILGIILYDWILTYQVKHKIMPKIAVTSNKTAIE